VRRADKLSTFIDEYLEIWEPQTTGTLGGCPGLKRNCFTFCRDIGRQLNNLNEPVAFEVELAIENLSSLTPYVEEIIGDHQCGFRRNWPNTDHTQTLGTLGGCPGLKRNCFTFCIYIGRQLNNLNGPVAFEVELAVEKLSSLNF
jgi:hypothetical protein